MRHICVSHRCHSFPTLLWVAKPQSFLVVGEPRIALKIIKVSRVKTAAAASRLTLVFSRRPSDCL